MNRVQLNVNTCLDVFIKSLFRFLRFVYLKVRALSSWSRSEETNETKLELTQPFSSTLSQMSLHTLSHSSQREQRSSHHVCCHTFTSSFYTIKIYIYMSFAIFCQFDTPQALKTFETVFFNSIYFS